MNRSANVVVGLGWGDEGKGAVTDYLCSKAQNPLVIRFNGGQQAGHTVCLPDGRRHVFSNFGAGTLRGVPTYWSAYCTCSISNILNEYEALIKQGVSPQLYLDAACPITTHYDVLYNQLLEQQRGNGRHGSCGMGFGTTLQRQESNVYFTAGELLNPKACVEKLAQIRNYYAAKATTELAVDFNSFNHAAADTRFKAHLIRFLQLLDNAFFITNEAEVFANQRWSEYVFEGAQGILLDMEFGVFPHVTRSNTTSKNALEIISRNRIEDVTVNCVSRCYHTRHGEGPFVENDNYLSLKNNAAETNVFNQHQGNFKTAPLDINQMQYALQAETSISGSIEKNLFFTCLDQVNADAIPYTQNGELKTTNLSFLTGLLQTSFQQVLFSNSPCNTGVQLLQTEASN